jgi:drug/metabolite transporter (DMT)-like permease
VVPIYIVNHHTSSHIPILYPLAVGLTFIAGQTFSLLSLKYGDVSVATPLLGTKVIMVAFFTVVLLGISVPLSWWIASTLAVLALLLLRGQGGKSRKNFLPTVVYSLLCAASFALSDILIQKWARLYNPDTFIFEVFVLTAILSVAFIPFFCRSKLTFTKPVSLFFTASIVCIAVQTVLMAIALGRFGNATAINIVFSSRTMWSVLFVWWFGKMLDNNESDLGKRVFFQRLAGSALILGSMAIVMMTR